VAGFDPDPRAGAAGLPAGDWRRAETISATVRGADLVVLCLPERLELVQTVLQRAQAEVPEGGVIAVDTGAFNAEAVQGGAIRPGQIVQVTGSGGGFELGVTGRNDAEIRAVAGAVLAELAAVASLAGEPPAETFAAGRPDAANL